MATHVRPTRNYQEAGVETAVAITTQSRADGAAPPGVGAKASHRLLGGRWHKGLPSTRALAGGFLVAVAAGATFSVASGHRPEASYVVAARAISAGERLSAGDFRTEPMRLPPPLSGRFTFASTAALQGTVAVVPLGPGELVQAGDVVSSSAPGARIVSFPVDPARALNGALAFGDRVDVLATYGTGISATTYPVVRSAKVLAMASPSGGVLGSGSSVVVTLAVHSPSSLLALAQAVNAAQVLLVRTTGDAPAPYPSPYPSPTGGQTAGALPGQAPQSSPAPLLPALALNPTRG